jgi:molybdopterin/thiamine biosynthesis adenylyltransferase
MNIASPEFSRNLGFLSESEQMRLHESTVSIAGAGGDGGELAIQLARLGVGELRLADPDPFERENINRQACATQATIGENKAIAVGRYVQDINPDIKVDIYEEGISQGNVHEFVKDSSLVIDETEFTLHSLGVMLAREARQQKVSNLMAMNIGFGATVTSFTPNSMTFEKMLGLSETATPQEVEIAAPAISRWLPYIPPYGDLKVFEKVANQEKSAPSIAPGVAMAAGMAATQTLLHLLKDKNNRPAPIVAPDVLVMDAMTGQAKTIKLNRFNHYSSLAKMVIRNKFKLNPQTSY